MEINRTYLLMGAGLVTILGLGALPLNHVAGAVMTTVGGLSYISIAAAPYIKKKWEERNVKVLTQQAHVQSSPTASAVQSHGHVDWDDRRF